jgi:hypothetical protein
VIVTEEVVVHPWKSVTVTLNIPAHNEEAVAVVCTGLVSQEYENGDVPPAGVTVAVPLQEPLHETFVNATVEVRTTGSVTVTEAVAVHKLASETVTV